MKTLSIHRPLPSMLIATPCALSTSVNASEVNCAQHEKQAAALQSQLVQLETQVGLLTEQYAHIAADYKRLAELLAQA